MKKDWTIKKLGDLCEVITKGTTPTSIGYEFQKTGINFIKVETFSMDGFLLPDKVAHISKECNETLKRSQLKEDDILFSIAGALGRTAIVDKSILPANTNQALAIIRLYDKNPISLKYLIYYFGSEAVKKQIDKDKGGVAQQNLSLKQISEFDIYIPPLEEQKRIVAVLDKKFTQIETLKTAAEKNLQNTKQLFQAELEKAFSNTSWERVLLSEIALDFSRGKSKHRPRNDKILFGGDYPFIQTGDIRNSDKYVTEYTETYNETGLAQSKLWPEGTLCITIAANIAETAILTFPCCFPDSIIGFIPNEKRTSVDYIYYVIQFFKTELQKLSKGAAQDNLNLAKLESMKFPLPPLEEQKRIVAHLDSLSEKVHQLEEIYTKQLTDCDELKQSFLQKAFEGEL